MRPLACALLLSLCSSLAVAQAPPGTGRDVAPGYLGTGAFDTIAVLPAPPTAGDARDEADRRIFRATRALQGSPRWAMAADDASASTGAMLRHFSCALGLQLTPERVPHLVALLQRATRDAGQAINASKSFYQRRRPYWVDEGLTCRPRAETGESFDYPSGHALVGWTWALVLAELDASRAGPVMARGRAFGESRVVCGVHNFSAVQAGQLAASALVAAMHGSPEFRADVESARAELTGLRQHPEGDSGSEGASCEVEARLVEPLRVAP